MTFRLQQVLRAREMGGGWWWRKAAAAAAAAAEEERERLGEVRVRLAAAAAEACS